MIHWYEGCADSEPGVVWKMHMSESIQCTSFSKVESSLFMWVSVIF